MRQPVGLCSPLLATLALASIADAKTLVVSPAGTETAACTREDPCALTTGASTAEAGDTVILLDGVYKTPLFVANSGTASAWITFKADDCATPIIDGPGDDEASTGAGSDVATYVRFEGLVSRGWNTGFGNGWTGEGTTNSNGNFEFKYCIADGNGRTGFTFYSASGLHIQNSISAHNGGSAEHSWSSGITLYEAQGSDNLVEGSLSFENIDNQKHTDGSGFIADESSSNATFRNNIAFGNGGSCLRLTKSSGTKFINNTCYHNAKDPAAQGPSNPGEVYFTQSTPSTTQGVTFANNVFISTGSGAGAKAIYNQPTSGWSNNVVQDGGSVSFFTSPDGTNPDFTLTASATTLIGKGTSSGAPTNDIGFNPKCIVKKTPAAIGIIPKGSWWQYSVDIDYIKSIGGVAKCFAPKTRSGTPDIGAYVNGAVTAPTACVPTATGGSGGASGASSTGGTTSAKGGAQNAGGTSNAAGTASESKGGSSNGNGGASNGGANAGGASSDKGGTASSLGKGGATNLVGGATTMPNSVGGKSTSTASSGGTSNSVAQSSNAGGATTAASSISGGSSAAAQTGQGGNAAASSTSTQASNVGGRSSVTSAGGKVGSSSSAADGTTDAQPASGCSCRVTDAASRPSSVTGLGLIGLVLLGLRRRRRMTSSLD